VAARTCIEQIIGRCLTLRYLGVPIHNKSFIFGDNESVVDSSSKIQSKNSQETYSFIISRVREAVGEKSIDFFHMNATSIPQSHKHIE